MSLTRKKFLIPSLGGAVFFSLLLLGEVGSGKEGKKLTEVRLGIPGTLQALNFFPLGIGKRKGIYLKEGIELEPVVIKAGILPMALAGGTIDYLGSSSQIIRAALVGIPVKLLLLGGRREPTFLVSRPEIKSVQDLKGRRIAVSSHQDPEYLGVKETLGLFGLDPERDVTLIATGPAIKEQALLGGSVDAAVTNFANIYLIRKRGFRELIKDLAEYSDFFRGLGQALGTREDTIKRDPTRVMSMIRAQIRSILYSKENREEMIDYIHKEWGWEKERAKEFHHIFLKIMPKIFSNPDIGALENRIEIERQAGIKIAPGFNLSYFLDFTLVKKVERELGILS